MASSPSPLFSGCAHLRLAEKSLLVRGTLWWSWWHARPWSAPGPPCLRTLLVGSIARCQPVVRARRLAAPSTSPPMCSRHEWSGCPLLPPVAAPHTRPLGPRKGQMSVPFFVVGSRGLHHGAQPSFSAFCWSAPSRPRRPAEYRLPFLFSVNVLTPPREVHRMALSSR